MEIGFYEAENACTKIIVVGVGGGGCNSVNRMIQAGVKGVEFIAVNTDKQALNNCKATKKLVIGEALTGGRGAGAVPDVGEKAALEDESIIKENLKGANLVFITAGMGGGTGTGAAPVIAKIAKDLGCLTVAVVTKPFDFEKTVKGKLAAEGIEKLEKIVDTLIVISNQALITNCSDKITLMDAWRLADDVLKQGVQGISDLIINSGEMNIDFADVQTVMKSKGKALMGIGYGKGENAAIEAVTMAIENPLMPELIVDKAKAILVNVSGSSNLSFKTYTDVMNFIQNIASDDALVIPGQTFDDTLEDKIKVTIIATGFQDAERVVLKPEVEVKQEMPKEVEKQQVNSSAKRNDIYSTAEFLELININKNHDTSPHEEPAYIRELNKKNKLNTTYDFLTKKDSGF